jgi:hypothetical protein
MWCVSENKVVGMLVFVFEFGLFLKEINPELLIRRECITRVQKYCDIEGRVI